MAGGDALSFHPSAPQEDEAGESDKEGDKDKKKDEWDVEKAPGERTSVAIDTDEGTWISLDVSPDGKTIVFDLLGDLYSLPIAGGEATPLTTGMAWDMQPRYSPDGRFIAFTSDRKGGDNIFVLPVEGGEARQVTKESFRLLNSPTWSPDGQFIVARKHFTARRSLGAGEMWLYHIAGGKGVQLTEKPNDQKDAGEPAYSPDGRYVYFSQDTTPGKSFEYNKNPHAGIYRIKRLDLEEARTDSFISGPGGAVRPTPSPDGKKLAYVRRVGLNTSLFVHDLESGSNRALYHKLDRDMQETWAIHGVYPAFAWTPDSASIVFWAGGKIRRIELASAKAKVIPFHVSAQREVVAALRFPVEVHPKRFKTKMLRWVQVSPDRRSVLFQALGHIYIRALPDAKPRRLTRDKELEFYPSFSRDGKSVVYTTWDDEKLGSVRIVKVKGGRSRTITRKPGHYIEPALSPDGRKVVYRRVRGGRLRSQKWSHDPGIYVADVKTGDAELVSRSGSAPQFGASSERVFFVDAADEKTRALYSIELSGAEKRAHLKSKRATEFRVAPNGKWVAFRESFQAFITPFPPTGKAFEIGPKAKAIPIAKVSKDAGEYLHWAGDSRRLYWALGPELYARDLKDAFDFIDGAPEKLPEPPKRGAEIGLEVDADLPKGKVAIVGARIVTMKGDEVIENGTIVIDRNRIAAIGDAGTPVPRDAFVLKAAGMTVIPGLVDVHAHGPQGANGIIPQQNWLHYATLAFGVTTVHDPSNDTATIFAAAELARAGMITAPRIYSTGTILYGADSAFKADVENLEDARRHVRRMKAVGAISVKSYNQPRRNQRQEIVAAAREIGMMVVPEGGSLYQHNMTMVVDGHTGIEHAIPIARGYKDMKQLWAGTKVGYTPTLGVGYGGLWGENYWYAHTNVFENEKIRAFVPPRSYEGRARRRTLASAGDWNHIKIAKLCKELLDAGVTVQLGAHGQREGLAAHWELWMFVQGGMTPHEALRAGTLHGARYVGLDGDIGSLEVGKLADLAVIDGNPLDDIRVSERVKYTMVNGRVYDATSMDEVGNRKRKRKPFHWQKRR